MGLYLKYGASTLKGLENPSYIGIRQQHHGFESAVCMEAGELAGGHRAGLALVQSNEYSLRLEVSAGKAEVILCEKGLDHVVGETAAEPGETTVFLRVDGLKATLGLKESGRERVVAGDVDIRALSTETAGGFVGCTVGMYAIADGKSAVTDGEAAEEICFRRFSYKAL